MSPAALIRTLLLVSMFMLMFGLGLRSAVGDAGYVLRRPRLLIQSLVAMYVVMPLVVIGLVLQLNLRPPVKIALAALSLSPVPPFLPGKQLRVATSEGYIYGLLVAASLFAVVVIPLATAAIAAWLVPGPHVRALAVLKIVALTVLLPLVAGILARRFWPAHALPLARILNVAGFVLLAVAFIPVLVKQLGAIRSLLGDGTLLAIVAFTCIGLAIGHALGGPDQQNRTALALATASRHPAVALAIATASFPQQRLVPAAVLLALVVGLIAAAPYTAWRRRVYAPTAHPESPSPRSPT